MIRVLVLAGIWAATSVGFVCLWSWALSDRRRAEREAEVAAERRRARFAALADQHRVDDTFVAIVENDARYTAERRAQAMRCHPSNQPPERGT